MSEEERRDIDLATAAEQSSEEDEAQEGNVLDHEVHSVDAAEHVAIHVIDDEAEDGESVEAGLEQLLDALDAAADPEADAIVADALHIDSVEEADAALAAATDEETVEAEEAAIDPYEEFRGELRGKPGKWYVIHSYAGFEKRVKQNIESRKISMAMEDHVFEVQVPMEDVVEIKNGQRKLVTRVRIPGYVLVRMELNEDSWSVVRHTPGVTGFVGNSHNPTPLRFEEAFNMLKSLVQVVEAPVAKGSTAKGKSTARVIPAEID
ncbi:MAG TPA: transcription termination/antitermination NusG family protein, partial [Pseudolysinimonas sp.]|nr:transcription termination/antitermination NusG family protein [Pseudolysinimonas sp.]